jgi:hypothetical protein
VPKNHARKNASRRAQQRTGASYASAAAGTTHQHPAPDLSALAGLPYGGGRRVDVDLAARLVGACRAGCRPCQDSLIPKALGDRALVAVLAGAVYGMLPTGGAFASAATRAWMPAARAARASGDGTAALAALEAMEAGDVAELLEDALDHWAAGGAGPDLFQVVDLDPPGSATRGTDSRTEPFPAVPSYAVLPGTVTMSDGRPLPSLTLEPETPGAGYDDLRQRTGWRPWDMRELPELDTSWRLRVDIATRSLQQLVHVDDEGFDDVTLWEAARTVTLPEQWWDLLDRAQHVLVSGPAGGEQLLAVVARCAFL